MTVDVPTLILGGTGLFMATVLVLFVRRVLSSSGPRQPGLRSFASSHGFTFEGRSAEFAQWARTTKFVAIRAGPDPSNVMRQVAGQTVIVIADCPSGLDSPAFYTVCLVRTPGLQLPHVVLQRNRGLNVIERLAGVQDLDFADDPTFSKAFVVQTNGDEARMRRLLTSELRRRLLDLAPMNAHLEGLDDGVLVHFNRPLSGPKLEVLLTLALETAKLLAAAAP
jgi:hypothetical protein